MDASDIHETDVKRTVLIYGEQTVHISDSLNTSSEFTKIPVKVIDMNCLAIFQ